MYKILVTCDLNIVAIDVIKSVYKSCTTQLRKTRIEGTNLFKIPVSLLWKNPQTRRLEMLLSHFLEYKYCIQGVLSVFFFVTFVPGCCASINFSQK